jgi:acetate kinase
MSNERVLVLNAGSSSLKFGVYDAAPEDDGSPTLRGEVKGIGTGTQLRLTHGSAETRDVLRGDEPDHQSVLKRVLPWLRGTTGGELAAAGHRVVHGGMRFAQPTRVDDGTLEQLRKLTPLAPGHQPHNLAPIDALRTAFPEMPQIACFDTAFHRSQPEVAQRFALPRDYHDAGVRRFGFHGLSYQSIAEQLPAHMNESADGRVVVAHLGHGASMAGLHKRRSVATTMGFTALDGLPMGKRCGTLDPGVILHLLQETGMSSQAVSELLHERSGLLGVSGETSDVAQLLRSNSDAAREALELFTYSAARAVGSLAAALEGLDALVFTAGIGENAPAIREDIVDRLGWLGIGLDVASNEACDTRIESVDSVTPVLVLHTDEEAVIARATKHAIAAG